MSTLAQLDNRLNDIFRHLGWDIKLVDGEPLEFLRKLDSKVPIKGYSSPPFVHSQFFLNQNIYVENLCSTLTNRAADKGSDNLGSMGLDSLREDKRTELIEIANGIRQVMQDGIEVHDQLRSESVSNLQGTSTEYISGDVEGFSEMFLDAFCRNDMQHLPFFLEFDSDSSDEFHVPPAREKGDALLHIRVLIGDKMAINSENHAEILGQIRACIGLTPEEESWEAYLLDWHQDIHVGFDESLLLERARRRLKK